MEKKCNSMILNIVRSVIFNPSVLMLTDEQKSVQQNNLANLMAKFESECT